MLVADSVASRRITLNFTNDSSGPPHIYRGVGGRRAGPATAAVFVAAGSDASQRMAVRRNDGFLARKLQGERSLGDEEYGFICRTRWRFVARKSMRRITSVTVGCDESI
jgi:hypothetical protein